MKTRNSRSVALFLVTIAALAGLWYWAERHDYFNADYRELTNEQKAVFEWKEEDGFDIYRAFRQHIGDTAYSYPGQPVSLVKLFRNIPLIGVFTGETLKDELVDDFVVFCNDSSNFTWAETTWAIHESEYYVKLYNDQGKVVGKVYLCLQDCRMTAAVPFTPNMKFGGLSRTGFDKLSALLNDGNNWN